MSRQLEKSMPEFG